MTKMLFKVCTVIICSLLLYSCGKEPNEWDEQQSNDFYGYKVENKNGLDMVSINQCEYNEDTTLLTGIRNEKVWIGLFEEKSKKQLTEWSGSETINRTIKVDLGYGEQKEFEVTEFRLNELYKTTWGFVSALSYIHREGNNLLTSNDVVDKDIVLVNGNKLTIYHTNGSCGLISNWFQNSIICQLPRNNYIVLSPEGKEITTLKEVPDDKWYINLIPVSYTEDIGLIRAGMHPQNEELGQYTRIRKRDHAVAKNIWSTDIPSLKNLEGDAHINTTVLEQNNPIWKFQIDITNRNGSKQQIVFTINVETGELTEI